MVPSLDGLRALSIGLVILGHLSGTQGFGLVHLGIGDYAELGVRIFFVISGFLITTLLADEYAVQGRVSLKLFYIRRSLRIFPAALAYLAVAALLWFAGLIHLTRADMLYALTYTVNYSPDASWQIGHLWSLSVEEQFYLIWPFAYAVLGTRRAVWAAAGTISLAVLARGVSRIFWSHSEYYGLPLFPMVADSLAVGCLLAMLRSWLEARSWYVRLLRPLSSLSILAAVLVLNRYQPYTVCFVFGGAALNVGIAVLIHRSIYFSQDWLGDMLNSRPFVFAGMLSYSLYLWQQLFLDRSSQRWFNAFPQNLACAIAAALISYYIVEKPFLKLRRNFRAINRDAGIH